MIRLIFSIVILSVALSINAATQDSIHAKQSARLDFISENGVRYNSRYPEIQFIPMQIINWEENKKSFYPAYSPGITNVVEVVPWGINDYDLIIKTDNELSYTDKPVITIIDAENGDIISKSKGIYANEIKSGTWLKIDLLFNEDVWPSMTILNEFTGVYNWSEWDQNKEYKYYHSSSLSNLNDVFERLLDKDNLSIEVKQDIIDNINSTGVFRKVSGDYKEWEFCFQMPNEPVSISISSDRANWECMKDNLMFAIRSLYNRYPDIFNYMNTGEPFYLTFCGEFMSGDYISDLFYKTNCSWDLLLKANNRIPSYAWNIAYSVIASANLMLDTIDRYPDVSKLEKDNAKACMLALRSHAYWRLLQLFGERWSDSNNGESLCAPLELHFLDYNLPLSSMKQIINQCYSDLDESISIMDSNNFIPFNEIVPDVKVAKSIKMRIAMLCQDWEAVEEICSSLYPEITMTSNSDYLSGFRQPCNSWIWSFPSDQLFINYPYDMMYHRIQTLISCNSITLSNWGMASGAIDLSLYNIIPPTDIRKECFVTPELISKCDPESKWAKDDTWFERRNLDYRNHIIESADSWSGDYKQASETIFELIKDLRPISPIAFSPFKTALGYVPIMLGSQIKFYCDSYDAIGYGDYALLLRSEEILLSYAEALYHLGHEEKARDILIDLNGMRNPEYECSLKGQNLLNEIYLSRKIELWGEGHSWFDMKRWGIPITRSIFEANNPDSGNWPDEWDSEIRQPQEFNGWRYPIPADVVKNNSAIDISLMRYKDVAGYE